MSDASKLDQLRLIRSEQVGPATFHELVRHFGGAREALEALPELARRGGRRHGARVCSVAEAERELEAARRCGAILAAPGEEAYPPLLARIDVPPPLLYVKGDPALWRRPAIAMAGSRSASALGKRFAHGLAADLGAAGFVVVSGLARGIDAAAHQGALATGTAAVLAGGVDVVYPPENAQLYQQIVASGVALSEAPPGFQARAVDFPRRNRLISGASLGVIVVEAAQRSGSLITARMALEQNRQVFAVPGHPLDPRAEGGNSLLKQGACLVSKAQDVIDELAPLLDRPPPRRAAPEPAVRDLFAQPGDDDAPSPGSRDVPAPAGAALSVDGSERAQVLEALGVAPVSVDEVIRATGLAPAAVKVALLELELAGRLRRAPGQLVALR